MLSLPMACVVFTHDAPEEIYLVRHTHELPNGAIEAIRAHVQRWLLTTPGRAFIRKHEREHNVSLWAALFELHPDLLAKAPGILSVELLPCHPAPVYEEDDSTSPWETDYFRERPANDPRQSTTVRKINKDLFSPTKE